MLTIDDCNSIIGKYSHAGFWYTLDLTKLSNENTVYFDFIETRYFSGYYYIKLNNPFFHGLHYFTANGNVHSAKLFKTDGHNYDYKFPMGWGVNPDTLHLFFTVDDIGDLSDGFQALQHLFIPKYGLQLPVINGEFNDKFYINVIGTRIGGYVVDDVEVESGTDENGTFIRLPYAEDCIIGVKSALSGTIFNLYKVTFREFKSIPQLSVSTLYRGTPQTIQLINNDTEEPITEFQAYYHSRKLKDNIIELPYDAPEVVDITVDLLDPEYPESTVKLKAPSEICHCTSQAQVEIAIANGIKTMKIRGASDTTVYLTDLVLNNIMILEPRVHATDCTFNNVTVKAIDDYSGRFILDNGGNTFNECNLSNLNRLGLKEEGSQYTNCIFNEIHSIQEPFGGSSQLQFTGEIIDCTFNKCVVVSDGDVRLTDCTFTGSSSKDYFPNFLYLTGDFTVKNNTFTLNSTWQELAFNMCIIKTNPGFNPSQFIAENTFNLNIRYGEEPTNTFYYCLVDDDKIRAVRL